MTPARTLAAALLAMTALPLGATAQPAVACPSRVSTTPEGWRRVAAPAFAAGGAAITAYAVLPNDPGTLLATNGEAVVRSRDDGCTWQEVYRLPDSPSAEAPYSASTARVTEVVAGKQRTYLLLSHAAGPRVLVTANGGTSWTAARIPPTAGDVGPAASTLVADASGLYAYVTVRTTGGLLGTGELLYATEDGGATWNPRPVDVEGGGVAFAWIDDIAVDPLLGTDVWATTTNGLFKSGDAGRTWTQASAPGSGGFGHLAVSHRADTPVQVVVASRYENVVYVRRPGGGWTTVNTPTAVTSAAPGRTVDQVAITTAAGAYELDFDSLTWVPMHRGAPELSRLSTDATGRASFHACACGGASSAIWSRAPRTFAGGRNPGTDRGVDNPGGGQYPGYYGCAPDSKNHSEPPVFGESTVSGPSQEVVVAPGQSATVPVRFRVQPRELDLYFLLDSGPRSYEFGCAAKQGTVWAAHELARTRNLRVGLGQYRDYLVKGQLRLFISDCFARVHRDFVYRRDLRMGAVDEVFRETVGNVGWGDACTGDYAGLPALLQAATGVGQDVAPRGPSPYDIPPGHDAAFAENAFKVIVHVAGGYFSRPSTVSGYPGPEFEPVIQALNDNGIKQVGVYVAPQDKKKHHGAEEPVAPDETGSEDLRRVAMETGTLAATGVDCGRRVKAHVQPGDPLVCSYIDDVPAGSRKGASAAPPMGRQIVDLMNALRDVQPMRLAVLSGDAGVSRVAPAVPRRLDHLRGQVIDYTVTFRCAPSEAGTTKRVELGGEVGSTVVARTTATVRCGAPPVVRQLPEVVAALPPVIQVAAPVANTVPNTQLAPNTAPQPQAQGQHGMQGAAMTQEESEHQLAYADVGKPPSEGEELAMSALPRRSPYEVPPWVLAQIGAVLATGVAWQLARRTRTTVAFAGARRRRPG